MANQHLIVAFAQYKYEKATLIVIQDIELAFGGASQAIWNF